MDIPEIEDEQTAPLVARYSKITGFNERESDLNIVSVHVRYSKETEEYMVDLILNSVLQPKATYFTDDEDDAHGTALDMLRRN